MQLPFFLSIYLYIYIYIHTYLTYILIFLYLWILCLLCFWGERGAGHVLLQFFLSFHATKVLSKAEVDLRERERESFEYTYWAHGTLAHISQTHFDSGYISLGLMFVNMSLYASEKVHLASPISLLRKHTHTHTHTHIFIYMRRSHGPRQDWPLF